MSPKFDKSLNIRLTAEQLDALKKIASSKRLSISRYIRRLADQFICKPEKK